MNAQRVRLLGRQWAWGLLRHPDFRRLWVAQTVSVVGSQLTSVALPLTAVLTLRATPLEMGLLGAAANMPILLGGLFAGVWVDRLRRRPILIVADLGQGLLLATIPLAAFLGLLRIEMLYAIAILVGTLKLFFDVAVTSYLPVLVRREELAEGNSKIQLSYSAADVTGPGVAGGLVQLIGAPFVLLLDTLSFLVSAAFLRRIRSPEPTPIQVDRQTVWREIGDGLRLLWKEPVLRAMTLTTGVGSLGNSMQQTVLVLVRGPRAGSHAGTTRCHLCRWRCGRPCWRCGCQPSWALARSRPGPNLGTIGDRRWRSAHGNSGRPLGSSRPPVAARARATRQWHDAV